MWIDTLKQKLIQHEGRKTYLYKDTVNKWTIGVGYNIEDKGLPNGIIDLLLTATIQDAVNDIKKLVPNFDNLSDNRKIALADWSFNLGFNKLQTFKNTITFLNAGDFKSAADNMMKSLWAKQVGQRAIDISEMVRNG